MNNRPTRTASAFALTAAILLSAFAAGAAEKKTDAKPQPAIELGAPFADNAILQRQMPVPVWGWSKPGTKVTVEFAGQKKSATPGKDGKWMLKLDALKASANPQEMVITDSAGNKVTLKNILVGEVWLASGQSNMDHKVSTSSARIIAQQLAKSGNMPPIREVKAANVFSSLYPIEHAKGVWSDGSNFMDYSCIAFPFAYKLYQELHIPIGIVNCAFSMTSIEAWIPRAGLEDATDEYSRGLYKKVLETDPRTAEHKAAWNQYYQDLEGTIRNNAERMKKGLAPQGIPGGLPGNLHGNRDVCWMFNGKLNPMIPYAIRGGIWNQGYANMGGGITYYNNLHSLIRGWRKRWNKPELPVYFHQFYCPNGVSDALSIGSTAEMRLGTWLARDIPHADMASQIDISGGIHYFNKAVPGQRLALLALKNQYGRNIVADGPMFKSYKVDGSKLIVEFDFAQGGLVVAETGTEASPRTGSGFANPTIIKNGDDKVTLFYLAGKNRLWYRAKMKIAGDKVVVTSPKVSAPHGVAYATSGVGFMPNIYNHALLPMTPFIFYDNKLVTSKAWPDSPVKVDGVEPSANSVGKKYEYRKMPILGTQFRDDAVIQAGVPVTFWGSAVHDWGYEAKGTAVIKFSFAGIEKTIPVKPGMREWRYTVPAMPASAEPKTLKLALEIDGQVAHERECKNIVVGDVWYISAPVLSFTLADNHKSGSNVRLMTRKAKRSTYPMPHHQSVATSSTPKNRFASEWRNASGGIAGCLGGRIHAKTGKPVGIVLMQGHDPALKSWIGFEYLKQAPSLMADYESLAAIYPGNPIYDKNTRRYIDDWKSFWQKTSPQLLATKRLPEGAASVGVPSMLASKNDSSQTYNALVCTFAPGNFKGIIFLSNQNIFEEDQGANYGPELSALANCMKEKFGGADQYFFYTIPSKALAPKITRPTRIKGKSTACQISHWLTAKRGDEADMAAVNKQLMGLVDQVVNEAYK